MQTAMLPASVTKEMDKIVRKCIWGDKDGHGKYICSTRKHYRTKKGRGIGLRRSGDMNNTLLARLGWHLLKDGDAL